MPISKYVHGAFTSAFNTEETLDFAFLTGPKTWTAITKSLELLKSDTTYTQVSLQPADDDCLLLNLPDTDALTELEHEALRENKPVERNPVDILSLGLTQCQYTFTIEILRRRNGINIILVIGDEPISEARCTLGRYYVDPSV